MATKTLSLSLGAFRQRGREKRPPSLRGWKSSFAKGAHHRRERERERESPGSFLSLSLSREIRTRRGDWTESVSTLVEISCNEDSRCACSPFVRMLLTHSYICRSAFPFFLEDHVSTPHSLGIKIPSGRFQSEGADASRRAFSSQSRSNRVLSASAYARRRSRESEGVPFLEGKKKNSEKKARTTWRKRTRGSLKKRKRKRKRDALQDSRPWSVWSVCAAARVCRHGLSRAPQVGGADHGGQTLVGAREQRRDLRARTHN